MQDTKKENEQLLKENKVLKKRQADLSSSINILQLEKDKKEEQIAQINEEIVEIRKTKEEAQQKEAVTLQAEIEQKETNLKNLQEEIAVLGREKKALLADIEEERSESIAEIGFLTQTIEDKEIKLTSVNQIIASKEEVYSTLSKKITKAKSDLAEVEGKSQELEKLLKVSRETLAENNLQLQKIEKRIAYLKDREVALKEQEAEVDKKVSDLAKIDADIAQKRALIEDLDESISGQKSELADLEKRSDEINQEFERIGVQKLSLVDKIATLKRAQQVIKGKYEKAGLEYTEINF